MDMVLAIALKFSMMSNPAIFIKVLKPEEDTVLVLFSRASPPAGSWEH